MGRLAVTPSPFRETKSQKGQPLDIDNSPEAYFEAMRRLRPEPSDEETVERIVEIFSKWCRRQERRATDWRESGRGNRGQDPVRVWARKKSQSLR